MVLKRMNSSIIQFMVLCFSLSMLTACSRDKVNEPTEIEDRFKDKISMKRLWKSSVGTGDDELSLQLTPVLIDDYIYSIDVEGELYVIRRDDGKKVWVKSLNERVSGGLGADKQNLYYTTFQGEIVCIDRQTAEEKWRQVLTSESISAPSSNGRLVLVQTIDGKLLALDVSDGRQRWRYDSIGPILSLRGTPSPIVSQKYTITSFANGEMLAFDNQTGNPFWKATLGIPQGRTELERLVDPDGRAVIDGSTLYAVAYQGKLVALDVTSGQEIWAKDLSSFNHLALGFGKIFATTADGVVVALNQANGQELWRNEKLKYRRLGPPVVFDQMVLTVDLEGYLHALSVQDGDTLARKQPDSDGVMGNILISGKQFYVYARSGDIVAYKHHSVDDTLQALKKYYSTPKNP